ncbi:MAG: AI-2E family transporter [Bacteroidota bacterium]|nr:AI-2E family transporter [Bacteroidota bacterium]
MQITSKLPNYARLAFILLSITLILLLLYLGQHILVPILMSLLFAILLRPVVRFMNVKMKFPHVIAVLIAVVIFVLLIASIVLFVSNQIGAISSEWETIKSNLEIHYHHLQKWAKQTLNISYKEQENYIKQATNNSITGDGAIVGNTLSNFTDVLFSALLIPFYTFLILLYRNLFMRFLSKLVKHENQGKLQEILLNIKIAVHSFLVGLLFEMGIVTALTTVGYMIIGVPYALLLGVITGLLNLIPYIGILIAGVLSIIATLTISTDFSNVLGVVIINVIVQLIDNNLIVPLVVSSKVRINAIISVIAIVIGGAVAGVAGMFLAIPILAIIKVIFDRIETLEPWGYLIGDDLPKTFEFAKLKFPSFDAGNNNEHSVDPPKENTSDKL